MSTDGKVEAQLRVAARYFDLKQWAETEAVCHTILEVHPDQPDALYMLALSEMASGKSPEAREHLTVSIAVRPKAEPLNDLGTLLKADGHIDDAINCFSRAIELKPNYAIALNNLGNALRMKGRLSEAIGNFRAAAEHGPEIAEIHNNLGVALRDAEQLDAAENCFNEAIRIQPAFAQAWSNLGNVMAMRGDNERARQHYEKSLEMSPNDALRLRMATLLPAVPNSEAESRVARERFREDIRQLAAEGIRIADPLNDVGTTPFYLAYQGQNDRADVELLAALYRQACPSLSYTAPHCQTRYLGADGRRIKVGFISSYFYQHTIGRLMEGLIRLLPRDDFEVHLFASDPKSDEMAGKLNSCADHYRLIPRSLPDARDIIAAAELDILVHAGVGLDPLSYFLAYARLAPAQCVTWGHPVTSGLDTMDYYISCAAAEIEDADAHYTETLVRLPHYTTHFEKPKLGTDDWTREKFGLPPTGTLYLCPQSLFKFDAGFDALIGAMLREDKTGQFIMIEGQRPEHTRLVKERFVRTIGNVVDRVHFLPRQSSDAFLGLISVADVVVDTPLFCGGNTSLEALALGTPVVTMPSEFRRGRLTFAQYQQMGMSDCIATDEDHYVILATRIGCDRRFRNEAVNNISARVDILFENDAVITEHAEFFSRAVKDAVS